MKNKTLQIVSIIAVAVLLHTLFVPTLSVHAHHEGAQEIPGAKQRIENVENNMASPNDTERVEQIDHSINKDSVQNNIIIFAVIILIVGGAYLGWKKLRK